MLNYLQSGNGRLFVKKSDSCNTFEYAGCISIDSISHSLGDNSSIYCPSDSEYNAFEVIATIQGTESRPTFSLSGYVPTKSHSLLYQYYLSRCTFDIQIHYGECFNPTDFGTFDKSINLNGVTLSSYNISNLTTLGPDGRGLVSENVDASAESFYMFHRPTIQTYEQSASDLNGPLVALTSYCNNACAIDSCEGSCAVYLQLKQHQEVDSNTNCPTLQVINECDGTTENIDLIHLPQISNAYRVYMSASSQYLFITIHANGQIQFFKYLLGDYSTLIASDTVTTTAGVYQHFNYGEGIIVGDTAGNINVFENSAVIIDTITDGIYSIGGIDEDNFLIGVGFDATLYHYNEGIITSVTIPNSQFTFAVEMLTETKWVISGSTGLYLTCDSGATWTQLLAGCVRFLEFSDDNIGYAILASETGATIYMTLDGGLSFSPLTSDAYSSAFLDGLRPGGLTVCENNPESIRAVGWEEVGSNECAVNAFLNGNDTAITVY